MKAGGLCLVAVAASGLVLAPGIAAQRPAWLDQLRYQPAEVFAVRRGHVGMPFVQVGVGDSVYWLLFDTGNMAGLILSTTVLDRLRLPETGRWDSRDADGRVIGTYREARAPVVRVLGRTLVDATVREFRDPVLDGLVGPGALPDGDVRFTLDYEAGLLAVSRSPIESLPPGATVLPLVRSARHPRLILVTGGVNGQAVLIELDTGASRSNIDPALVRDLALPTAGNGVRIDSLALGPLTFVVPSARVNPKSGIDPALRPPLQLAIGSDILAQLIVTVDYAGGRLILLDSRTP